MAIWLNIARYTMWLALSRWILIIHLVYPYLVYVAAFISEMAFPKGDGYILKPVSFLLGITSIYHT